MSFSSEPTHREAFDSTEQTAVSPEVQEKINLIAQKVEEVFRENPEVQEAFKSLLHETLQPILRDPIKFHKLVDRLYDKYEADLISLSGRKRTEKIQDFSTFITKVMEEYAAVNHMTDLQTELSTVTESLQTNTKGIEKKSHDSLGV